MEHDGLGQSPRADAKENNDGFSGPVSWVMGVLLR